MRRLSARRGLLYAGLAVCAMLFFINFLSFQQRDQPPWAVSLTGASAVAPRSRSLSGSRNGTGPPVPRPVASAGSAAAAPKAEPLREPGSNVVSADDGTLLVPEDRHWFFSGGRRKPGPGSLPRELALWPEEDGGDRIVNQLLYRPPPADSSSWPPRKLKKILLYDGFGARLKTGQEEFVRNGCPVNTCELTTSRSQIDTADAVLFKDRFHGPHGQRRPGQAWIMYLLECPMHTVSFKHVQPLFNWTATYRHDSDIVAPYEKWVYYDDSVHFRKQEINYAAKKTKKVAWFVSNCGAINKRLQYAKELAKYIEVDIYGSCGTKKCPRSMGKKCFEKLSNEYKFYLAFENSNCRDYITEKFFVNGLQHNVLPIVMGAHPDDYKRAAPEHSYIHVDDFKSPQELADFLHALDRDDHLYNSYFQWKGTGEFINTYFFCRLCAMLHDEGHQKTIPDLNEWWRGAGTCVTGKWPRYTPERT
ncbi:glycoprotein 3-alpha-L-fucosyltransferase A-like [Amphibalanus amphitrite]|uniref:glycoprotein 3-alpha-L-fucosyltransferase A-like n=1 Tax=Amphibalanus amphitrite TaxID=1232801 RepID=UPI001C8FB5D4|nr:glycoprotein 3-alpha-L-fucosyltransferase A-like [Amphibalanus amphitrite]XP_043230588.1 glycoprotein 3-alpha-L-fucosyltransferase A-like [Amphibalanus amphitrite]